MMYYLRVGRRICGTQSRELTATNVQRTLETYIDSLQFGELTATDTQ